MPNGNGMVHPTQWEAYRKAQNNFYKSAGKQVIVWRKVVANIDRFGEGISKKTEDIPLEVLMGYNDNRTWPVDRVSSTGVIDKENLWLYLNREYLSTKGFLNVRGYFDFNPGLDRFYVQGVEYKPSGDIASAQAEDNPLFILLVLEREEGTTGEPLR